MPTAIRVRMYRTGFGDCFLLTFGKSAAARHILIDFGVHMHGDIGTMDQIMANIEEATGSKLEIVVATHAHKDHISGFGKFAERFSKFRIGGVWLPWTDDPNDKTAASIKKKHLALYEILDKHLRIALGATERNLQYAPALNALSNLRGNETSTSELARGFGTGAKVSYFAAGASIPKVGEISGLSAEILAPSRDQTFLARMNPPADQHFLSAPNDNTGALRPFPKLEIRPIDPDYQALLKEGQPILAPEELNKLHGLTDAPADRLALALDSVRNNTSLVILLRYQGRALLFPGDAQWGNWQSWIGTDNARQLLGELDFFKVAHHGSENATPVDVLHALRSGDLAAMVPTQIEPFPTIPRLPLLKELEEHCANQAVVRSDWIEVNNAPKAPSPKPKLPKAFKAGDLWIDYEF